MNYSTFFALLLVVTLSSAVPADPALAQHDAHQLGETDFPVSCSSEARKQFETGVAQLHHMMYEQARTDFEAAAEADPECAMAYWGIAMTRFQPLWNPTSDENLERGRDAVDKALAIGAPTEREQRYIAAVDAFFTDPEPQVADRAGDHEARVENWMQAQQELHEAYPENVDAAAFHALAQIAWSMTQHSPDEKRDYARERRAGELLERYREDHPEHPGLYHYQIHAYDSAELAHRANQVAQGYDQLAPDTPHALHMPSHTFVRLGKWQETAEWNERSAEAALRNPVDGQTSVHYPHALDYKMYAYLQLDDEAKARETIEKVRNIEDAQPAFASAYGIAAAQARYYLERQEWEEAAELEVNTPAVLSWEEFPAAVALFRYARGLGAARSGDLDRARAEHRQIAEIVSDLREDGDDYWAYMTDSLGKAVESWILYERGETEQALALAEEAADTEDSMDKHPTTPGEILPVRELYGELLLREGRADEALAAFEASLERTPNRRNALNGVARARAVAGR